MTEEVSQMFPTAQSIPLFRQLGRTRALETWREAASLVATRWQNFLDAELKAVRSRLRPTSPRWMPKRLPRPTWLPLVSSVAA